MRKPPKSSKKPTLTKPTIALDVLYEDNHLLVINKPAGVLAQGDQTGDPDVLSSAKVYLKQKYNKPGNVFVGLVHRLDRPVSGIMVLARTSKAAERLSAQFRNNSVEKRYLALVAGQAPEAESCRDYLVKENQVVRIAAPTYPGAQLAELVWRRWAQTTTHSLLEIDLKTGRPHQIRVQLAHRGLPIVGDIRYGALQEFDGQNLALHCFHLAIMHPTRAAKIGWTIPPPATWRGWFDRAVAELVNHLSIT